MLHCIIYLRPVMVPVFFKWKSLPWHPLRYAKIRKFYIFAFCTLHDVVSTRYLSWHPLPKTQCNIMFKTSPFERSLTESSYVQGEYRQGGPACRTEICFLMCCTVFCHSHPKETLLSTIC